MRVIAFILALTLLAGVVDPTRGWLTWIVVLTGFAAMRPRLSPAFELRPALDLRLALFVLAALLLAGAVEPTRGALIALSVTGGLAVFAPGGGGILSGYSPRAERWDADGGPDVRRAWRAGWRGRRWQAWP